MRPADGMAFASTVGRGPARTPAAYGLTEPIAATVESAYIRAMTDQTNGPLRGISTEEQRIMGRLLRQPHEQQKAAPKPTSGRAEAQRRRRERERNALRASAGTPARVT